MSTLICTTNLIYIYIYINKNKPFTKNFARYSAKFPAFFLLNGSNPVGPLGEPKGPNWCSRRIQPSELEQAHEAGYFSSKTYILQIFHMKYVSEKTFKFQTIPHSADNPWLNATNAQQTQNINSSWHCVTGANPTHSPDPPCFYAWYLPMSALYTGISFQMYSINWLFGGFWLL